MGSVCPVSNAKFKVSNEKSYSPFNQHDMPSRIDRDRGIILRALQKGPRVVQRALLKQKRWPYRLDQPVGTPSYNFHKDPS